MPSFNRCTLLGNLTRDPTVKKLPTTTVAEFGLAMSRRFKAASGEDREEVCFVDCAAFGGQAETIAQYCTKGRPIFIEGRLKFDSWSDKDGNKRSKVSVVVENFQFIGQRGEDSARRDGDAPAKEQQENEPPGTRDVQRFDRKTRKPVDGNPPGEFDEASIPF